MAKELGGAIGQIVDNVSENARKASKSSLGSPKGLAGAGLLVLAPVAARGASKLVRQLSNGDNPIEKARDAIGGDVKDAVTKKIDDAGGPSGVAKLPGMGGDKSDSDGSDGGGPDLGNSRRVLVQQAVDVAVPIETAYNQWTQFEEWPNFMHRLDRVTQEDESHVSFKTKVWGISREFTAEIVEQRPDERIKWRVTDGVSHTGVVTFHRLSDRLTRVDVDVEIQPGSLLEKAGRGMRHAKRAIRADLARFKAYIELEDDETGVWPSEIEDGDVKSRRGSRSSEDVLSISRVGRDEHIHEEPGRSPPLGRAPVIGAGSRCCRSRRRRSGGAHLSRAAGLRPAGTRVPRPAGRPTPRRCSTWPRTTGPA